MKTGTGTAPLRHYNVQTIIFTPLAAIHSLSENINQRRVSTPSDEEWLDEMQAAGGGRGGRLAALVVRL